MKDGPQLVIDQFITLQLIKMDEFWKVVPPGMLEDLKPMATEAAAKAMQIAMGQDCTGCLGGLRGVLTPIHSAVWQRVAKGQELGVDITGLIALIAAKRAYRPRPISVYYKDDAGFQRKLTF